MKENERNLYHLISGNIGHWFLPWKYLISLSCQVTAFLLLGINWNSIFSTSLGQLTSLATINKIVQSIQISKYPSVKVVSTPNLILKTLMYRGKVLKKFQLVVHEGFCSNGTWPWWKCEYLAFFPFLPPSSRGENWINQGNLLLIKLKKYCKNEIVASTKLDSKDEKKCLK